MSPESFATRLSRTSRFGPLTRWIERSDALVLMYHRISDVGPDPWRLAVSPAHFAEHVQVLRRHFRPTALRHLQESARKRGPSRVVVTFDDGYADNALTALSLLRNYDIPATVFVTTAILAAQRGFWWDELADLLLRPRSLPEMLHLRMLDRDFHWMLGPATEYGDDEYGAHRRWPAMLASPPTRRQGVYLSVWELMQSTTREEQRQVLDAMAEWSGNRDATTTHRMMNEAELASLAGDDLIEIGAHTVTHSPLPDLSIESQRREIVDSKDALAAVTGKAVDSFSYPYGRTSAATRELVRQAGFNRACTTRPSRVASSVDPFDIPRVAVPDCDGDQLERMLHGVAR